MRRPGLRHRPISAATAAAVLFAYAQPAPVLAAYNGVCLNDDNLHGYIDFQSATHINYVVGDITSLRDVLDCTGFSTGASDVLPTNIQGYAFVQLGYGRFSTSGALDWQYTPSDSSGGNLVNPSFNHAKPIVGHHYSLRLNWSSIAAAWQNYVLDVTANSGLLWQDSTNNRSYGNETWYGFEIHEFNDQYGGPGSGAPIDLTNLGYRYVGGSATMYMTTTSVHHTGTGWTYYHDGAYQDGGNGSRTVIWAYTDNH